MKIDDYKNRVNQLLVMADQALATKRSTDFGTFIDPGLFASFRSASLSFLKSLYSIDHPFYVDFNNECKHYRLDDMQTGKGIMLSVKEEIENGWLFSVKSLVTSEIFSDFLEMSKYLLDEKYKDPAAVMIGSVLEEHLRQLCLKNKILVEINRDGKLIPKKADLLNSELASSNIYNKLEQKNITAWLDLRNKAAHGKYEEYALSQVEIMYSGVLDFMNRNIL